MDADAHLFRHGVASGDPLADRVIIWTRVSPADERAADVSWMLATDPQLENLITTGNEVAHPDADLTVKVDVTGLEPDTTYYYSFECRGQRSLTGRTKTLPVGDVDHVRFAMYSCAKFSAGYFNAYARIADRPDLDFVLCLGDYIYEYGNDEKGLGAAIGRAFEPAHECRVLEDYRTRYAQYRRDPDVQALHQQHPLIAIPDDHEFCNDTWREGAGKHDPAQDGPWEVRKAAALQAYLEWIPIRLQPGKEDVLWRSFPFGELAHLVLLDTRTRRDKQEKPPKADEPDRTLLGREQFEWLTGELKDAGSTWRLVGNGVLIGQVKSDFMPPELDAPLSELGVITPRDFGPEPDQWDGYPAERGRLLNDVKENQVRNIVFLSGDVHSSWAIDLKLDPHDPEEDSIAVEFATTSVTSENLDDDMGWEPRTKSLELENKIIADNPHIHWAELDSHGYVVVDVKPERVQADWFFVEDIHAPNPDETLAASWSVGEGAHQVSEATEPAQAKASVAPPARVDMG